jgi:hypothetical protein
VASDNDGLFESIINSTGDSGAGFQLVDLSNPINLTRFAKFVILPILTGIVVGIQTTVDTLFNAVARVFWRAAGWLFTPASRGGDATGLIAVVQDGIQGIMFASFSPLQGLGFLAWPVAVAEVLVMLFVIMWAVSFVREEVL